MARIVKVSDSGEDATSDAPKRRMCWKCQKYNQPGAERCAFCGAEFATDEDRYQTDGRTISSEDDTAYLSAPPPKIKKRPYKIVAALAIVAVIFFISFSAIGYLHLPEIEANYIVEYEDDPWIQTTTEAHIYLAVKNNKVDGLKAGCIIPVFHIADTEITCDVSKDLVRKDMELGKTYYYHLKGNIPKADKGETVTVQWINYWSDAEYHIAYNPDLPIKWYY